MSTSRIATTLNGLTDIDNVIMYSTTKKPAEGGFKVVDFCNITDIVVRREINDVLSEQKTQIAVACATLMPGKKRERELKSILTSQTLLAIKKIPSDFKHSYLLVNDSGHIISEAADTDLFDYFAKHLELTQAKNLIAQAILAVYDFHSRNVVHRDIKPENFLVFNVNHQLNLRLADNDDLLEVTDDGKPCNKDADFFCTPEYLPPEFKDATSLAELNNKAVDCYTLGMTFQEMYEAWYKPKEKTHGQVCLTFQCLISSLLRKNPATRMSINEVMTHRFFGATNTECKAYFNEVRAKVKHKLVIDGQIVDFNSIKTNDAFLLLSSNLKNLYLTGKSILQEMSCADTLYHHVKQLDANSGIVYEAFETLLNHFKQFTQAINFSERQTIANHTKTLLTALKTEIDAKSESIAEKITQCTPPIQRPITRSQKMTLFSTSKPKPHEIKQSMTNSVQVVGVRG